jgi:psp operon transcriptional activator
MKRHTPTIIGTSTPLTAALDHISRLASIDRPALIVGERGTGKELAAERLHYLSPRWDQTLTKVNCGAITETLLESELFGHEAGAFTGATKQHAGRFELTDGGTLFLDELATMSTRLQEKILRIIEYGEFERVGGQRTLQVDVRIVAATNANLPALADRGVFRWDLLDRLSFDVVHLPPLRNREQDLLELAQHFSVGMCSELGWSYFPGFTPAAIACLQSHHWPGNIRELKNVVERSLFRAQNPEDPIHDIIIDPFHDAAAKVSLLDTRAQLDDGQRTAQGSPHDQNHDKTHDNQGASSNATHPDNTEWPISLKSRLQEEERHWLAAALEHSGQRQNHAASLLGLSYHQMRALVRRHQLHTRPRRRKQ